MLVLPSYRNHSIDLLCKWIDWFLYEGNTGTWWVKSKLQIIHVATDIALFLPYSNNCFFMYLVPYIPICLILCIQFHLFLSLRSMRCILQFTMFDSISLQPAHNIMEIRNTHSPLPRKKVCINYKPPNALTFSWNKVWVFSSSLSNYFLFSFWSGSCSHITF